ncbi:MAG: acyl-CoA/acyl-ACP dehydrogenase [Chloroflexi bacterium]|nr:acyl-CoA/acyl-ACP dehydrogenase [Chloroflexota bacterium]
MDFALSEEQELLRKTARDFLEKECPESFVRAMGKSERGYSPELWHKIADLGWLGLVFPEEYCGSSASFLDLAVLYEEFGRAMFPGPHLSTTVLCGLTILAAGSEAQKAELLPRIANGDLILALALTEASASFEPESVTLPAVPDGDSYVINGTKLFVYDAHIADYLLCVTRTRRSAAPEDGVTLFLVDAKDPGVSYTLLKTTAGDKPSEVVFHNVRVSAGNMVGKLHEGWAPLEKVIQKGAVLLCAEMVGAGRHILEMVVDYAKTRIQFDQPIGVNQHVQEHCVQLLAMVDGSRLVTYQAAWKLSQDLPADMEVAIAKAWASDAHEEACWRAHQVFAGVGYTLELGLLPLYSRRAKTLQLYLGDAAHHRRRVARQLDGWVLDKPQGKPIGVGYQEQK